MQSDIPFLRTRKPPGPQGCLMEKPLNFLHPLGNFEGCSRHYAPVLERFVILVSDHTNRREETSRISPLCQHTVGAKRDQSVMRQWATGRGKAMQCTTKDSAGTLPLNMSKRITCWRESWVGIQWHERNSEEDRGASTDLDRNVSLNLLLR